MSENPSLPSFDAGELAERLRDLEARFHEFRGRL